MSRQEWKEGEERRSAPRVDRSVRVSYWGEEGAQERPTVLEGDRRSAERVTRPIEVRFWCEGTDHQGRIEDLSAAGLFISTRHAWPVGSSIRFSFQLPEDCSEEPIEGEGSIAWIEPIGFAIRFENLEQTASDRIRAFVGSESTEGQSASAGDSSEKAPRREAS